MEVGSACQLDVGAVGIQIDKLSRSQFVLLISHCV